MDLPNPNASGQQCDSGNACYDPPPIHLLRRRCFGQSRQLGNDDGLVAFRAGHGQACASRVHFEILSAMDTDEFNVAHKYGFALFLWLLISLKGFHDFLHLLVVVFLVDQALVIKEFGFFQPFGGRRFGAGFQSDWLGRTGNINACLRGSFQSFDFGD